ncbi:unnamed protein product, partial [Ectocarpus sp. 12 AP-2014]
QLLVELRGSVEFKRWRQPCYLRELKQPLLGPFLQRSFIELHHATQHHTTMPPASRGRTAPPRPPGAGSFLPRFVAGAGRLNRRGEPGHAGSGGWGRLALAGLVLVLVVAFATRPLGRQPDAGSIGFTKPRLAHPTMPVRDGDSRFSRHGLLGNGNNIETETASGGGSADG